jgi:DNA repair protein RecN (Recombination protein N)
LLAELTIRDFAIIDELQLDLAPGFSAVTGETGAGKSIIIDAVELVLGGRADSTVVRSGADRAIVEATFHLDAARRSRVDPLLEREGLEGDEPTTLLLGREVRLEGRNVCRVNGRMVTLTLLREIAEGLVDIHGQSEHLSLLRVPEHLNLLDRYAELWPKRLELSGVVAKVRSVGRELADLLRSEEELRRRADLLQYQINEIESAHLEPGEEESLVEERQRLNNAEELAALAAEALLALEQGDGQSIPALDQIGAAARALTGLAKLDPTMEPQRDAVESASSQLEELARSLRSYQERLEFNPRRLQDVEDRLALIRRLERKHGSSIAEVLAYAERAARELDNITHSEERIQVLRGEQEELLAEAGRLGLQLSHLRRGAAHRLAEGIERELQDLRMEGARFAVDFRWHADPDGAPLDEQMVAEYGLGEAISAIAPQRVALESSGIDRVEFLVSPNPGEPPKPLARIASGGETSRLMLALKAVLSRADETPTLVFDEIDQGIGGRVGAEGGEKLWGLAAGSGPGGLAHQVLCVTHLPQLAGFGDAHLRVEKEVTDGRTVTRVYALRGERRVQELAAMLGASGEAAYRSAEEILDHVNRRKAALAG